jgi:RNA polymerase sigma factor (sigma-70 family)
MHVQVDSCGGTALSEPWDDGRGAHAALDDPSLLKAVREGDAAAYGVLYERHLGAARRAAAAVAATHAEREDLVAESFTKVLRILRSGHGPADQFRPYLLATIRNSMISIRRHDSVLSLVADVPEKTRDLDHDDPVGVKLHADVAAAAFARLPHRWRLVLWYTEVEGRPPAQVAPMLGLSPNGVAALAYRAREGLRQAYLDEHLPATGQGGCRMAGEQLAGWVRHTLTPRRMRAITAHLDHCARCRDLAADLRTLNEELP